MKEADRRRQEGERKALVVRRERNCTSSQARGSAPHPSLTCSHTGPRCQKRPQGPEAALGSPEVYQWLLGTEQLQS